MTDQFRKYSIGRILGASLLGVIAGLSQPIMLALSMLFVGGTVIAVTLYAFSGALPAIVFLVSSACSLFWLYGPGVTAAGLFLTALPALVIALMMRRGLPYFSRLRGAVAAQLLDMLALIVVLYFGVRQDLIGALMDVLTSWALDMPPALVSLALQQFALTGMLSTESAELVFSGALSIAEARKALLVVLDAMGQALRLGLPAMLLSSGLVTGVLATLIPGKICSRRGDGLPYVPVSGWFVPARLSIGLLVCLATGYALELASVTGAEAVVSAILMAASVIYTLAGAASLSRRFRAGGHGMAFRVLMIGAGILLVQPFVVIVGLCSALFGRQGLISGFVRRKMEEQDKEDNDK